jgi:AraC-like DNA-binding protein
MHYVGRAPGPPLDRFIDDIYCLWGAPRHRRLNVPPMPSAHLVINLGGPIRLHDSDGAVPPAVFPDGCFMGVWSRRFLIEYAGPVRVAGAHFKPWGMSAFVDVPSAELRDRWVPVDAVWARSLDRIRNRLAAATSPSAMVHLLEDELRSRLVPEPSHGLQLVSNAAGYLESSWGAVPVRALTDHAGVSSNQLAAQFKAHVGITPKRLARIYRFARLILTADATRPVAWSQLAQAAGYFDQAHLINEFKDFTGHTPTAYLDLRRRFPAQPDFPPDSGPMPAE